MRISVVCSSFSLLVTVLYCTVVVAFVPGARLSSSIKSSSHHLASIDLNEGATRNVGAFNEWATNCGVQNAAGFQLNSEDGQDWYAMTTADLPANSPVLAVPGNMILSTLSAKAELEAMSPTVQAAADRLVKMGGSEYVPKFYLFLKILVEFEKGVESPYHPWLDSVTRLYYNAVSMTDFCFQLLPPLVFRLSRDERVKFENLWGALQYVDLLSDELKKDREICKWAYNTVQTRRLPGDDTDLKIVPMVDYFNHGTETEVDVKIDEAGNCVVFTNRDVPAGYPLRMSYGCPTNPSYFFATYGFLDETSPGSFCKILDIQKTPELVDLGFDFSKMLFYKETGDVSQEVWDIVLYSKVLPKHDIHLQKPFYEAHMNGDAETKRAIHGQYMLEVCTELKNHVDITIKQLHELSAKADGMDTAEHPRLPLILRHNEFVTETFEMVRSRLNPMVAQLTEQRVGP